VEQRAERYADALRTAVQILGSTALVAAFLGVTEQQLDRWIAGVETPPFSVFVQTLELIGDTAYPAQRQPQIPASPRTAVRAKRSRLIPRR
jgi:hypothetical protein